MVNVCGAARLLIVTVPLRGAPVVFAVTVHATDPAPFPLTGEQVIQTALDVTVHGLLLLTVRVVVPPLFNNDVLVGLMVVTG
jgi:hypothetical protein